MLFFAYDGSIHGDWVSHYAVRLASHHSDKKLCLVHVRDGRHDHREMDAKISRIREGCDRQGLLLEPEIKPMERSVFRTLCSMISPGANSFVVCGTRVLGGGRGLLSGTVSERLLRAGESNVLALRVLQPGLLGCPRDVLLPVSGHPRGFRSGLPFLRLLGPDIEQMHILFVRRIARWRYRTLSSASADALRAPGQAFCERVDREIAEQLGLGPAITDANAIVSDDVPKEIVIAANKTKSRLIYLGASERNLSERFLYGNPIEQVLRDAACDVAVYRGVE